MNLQSFSRGFLVVVDIKNLYFSFLFNSGILTLNTRNKQFHTAVLVHSSSLTALFPFKHPFTVELYEIREMRGERIIFFGFLFFPQEVPTGGKKEVGGERDGCEWV